MADRHFECGHEAGVQGHPPRSVGHSRVCELVFDTLVVVSDISLLSVAWVPDDDPSRDWEIAARLAAARVDDRCQHERATGVLVTNTMDYLGVPALDVFAARHVRASPRAARQRAGTGGGPVLLYVPHEKELEVAMNFARHSSLGVVETVSFPLLGWASWFEAWDLVRQEPTPPLPESVRECVERLAFYGNNGFGDRPSLWGGVA